MKFTLNQPYHSLNHNDYFYLNSYIYCRKTFHTWRKIVLPFRDLTCNCSQLRIYTHSSNKYHGRIWIRLVSYKERRGTKVVVFIFVIVLLILGYIESMKILIPLNCPIKNFVLRPQKCHEMLIINTTCI